MTVSSESASRRTGAHFLKIGRIVIRQQNETEKKNPNSVRFLLGHIINVYFDGNIAKAARELRKFGGRYKDERDDRGPKVLNTKSILRILQDEDHVTYWHLEIFARFLGIPTGTLLLVSRMLAVARYNSDPEVAAALCEGVSIFANQLSAVDWHALSESEFRRFKDCFERLRQSEARYPTLF